MSHDLCLAQSHAWNLARTLMVPVILFKVDEEYCFMLVSWPVRDARMLTVLNYCRIPQFGGVAHMGIQEPEWLVDTWGRLFYESE
jgi:hypothetical protein